MLKAPDTELNAVLRAISEQREAALDQVAVLSGKLAVQEKLSAELQQQLNEALKPKGDV